LGERRLFWRPLRHRPDSIGLVQLGQSLACIASLVATAAATAAEEEKKPLEIPEGAVVGKIILDKNDVFNLEDERENNALYRLINKLHIITKDSVIESQLLLESGDLYSKRLADESARLLRQRRYLFDARVEAVKVENGIVDLKVVTKDVWTLRPGITFSRSGGESNTGIDIEELNLLGYGQKVRIARDENIDRTTKSFELQDPHILNSRVRGTVLISDNSDGYLNRFNITRPFYALDSRWSLGVSGRDQDFRTAYWSLGEQAAEYQQERQVASVFGGWSKGLKNNWVRRYRTGVIFDDNQFDEVANGTLPALVPEDRRLIYPFIGIEVLEDDFETATNKEQIGRTEDFFMGQRLTATLGYSSETFDADRNALIYTSMYNRGFGSLLSKALLTSARLSGRIEDGDSRNTMLGFNARYYHQQTAKTMFVTTVEGIYGHDLDQDNVVELGGDTGLRGYPLRYQTGDSKVLFTVEQRYFTDWYPFRLFRVGGAIFADVGRVWGESPVNEPRLGWLKDVGLGLRFASTRTGFRRMLHVDIAFPLDGDPSIDEVQINIESKKSF
jgi:outer membrane protein assembly factor BamA